MRIDGKAAFEFLKELSFERLSGSAEEKRAAEMLAAKVEEAGLKAKLHQFDVWNYTPKKAVLEVLEPYQKEYAAKVYGLTGCTADEGLVAEFEYVAEAGKIAVANAKDKIVLVNKRVNHKKYKHLTEAGVAGFIVWGGEAWREGDIPRAAIREPQFSKYGKIPGVSIHAIDAQELLQMGATKVRIVVKQDEHKAVSHNIIAEITGTKKPEEVIIMGAHYDSVPYSTGANDNGAGSVIILEMAKHFIANPPERTLRFVWFGSEETGLNGSFAYVKDHEEELKNIRLMLNIDVAGSILGQNVGIITGPESLRSFVEVFAHIQGMDMEIRHDVYSSDSVPFATYDIPSYNFLRKGGPIHDRYDRVEHLSAERLQEAGDFSLSLLDVFDKAKVFPVAREIPADVKKKLKEYLERGGRKHVERKKEE